MDGGQDDRAREVTTGLLQGPPIPPALFTIYTAEVHEAVEQEVEGCRGISFADDVTWLAEGGNLSEVVQRLEIDQSAMEERREGLRVETPASADFQTTLQMQTSDPGSPSLPARDEGRGGDCPGAPLRGGGGGGWI